jgi:hypothetical protein
MTGNKYINNTTENIATGSVEVFENIDTEISSNTYKLTGRVILRNCNNIKWFGGSVDSATAIAFLLENTSGKTCRDNTINNVSITNVRSGVSAALVETKGSGTVANTFDSVTTTIIPTSGLRHYSNTDGASAAHLVNVTQNGQKITRGNRFDTSLFKTVSSGSANSITIALSNSPSWTPVVIEMTVASNKADFVGGVMQITRTFYLSYVDGNNTLELYSANPATVNGTLAAVKTGNSLTITATHTGASGPNLFFTWAISVSSQFPVAVS